MPCRGLGTDHIGLASAYLAYLVPEYPLDDLVGRWFNGALAVFDELIGEGVHGRLSVQPSS